MTPEELERATNILPRFADEQWGVLLTSWGDVILSLGNVIQQKSNVKNIIYVGNMNGMREFLEVQDGVENVLTFRLSPETNDWEHIQEIHDFYWMLSQLNGDALSALLADTLRIGGLERIEMHNFHHWNPDYNAGLLRFRNIKIPDSAHKWALKNAPKSFILLHPYGFQSSGKHVHHPETEHFVNKIIKDHPDETFVFCAPGYDPPKEWLLRSNVLQYSDKTRSVMDLYALAHRSKMTVTTHDSLAHYCNAADLKTMILTRSVSDSPNSIWRYHCDAQNAHVFTRGYNYYDLSFFFKVLLKKQKSPYLHYQPSLNIVHSEPNGPLAAQILRSNDCMGRYGEEFVNVVDSAIRDDATVGVVGACKGEWVRHLQQEFRKFLLFEHNDFNCEHLVANKVLNNWDARIFSRSITNVNRRNLNGRCSNTLDYLNEPMDALIINCRNVLRVLAGSKQLIKDHAPDIFIVGDGRLDPKYMLKRFGYEIVTGATCNFTKKEIVHARKAD